jgi:hypothetical protein
MSPHLRPHRAALALALGLLTSLRAEPIISEFLAANAHNLADDDGNYSDWIELHNPDATPVNLAGWYLTDSATEKTKWQLPAVTLPAGGYLVVWASDQNRRDPAKPLHTNFLLHADGDYLALVKPDGVTVTTEFAPTYPAQIDDVSYGITQPTAAGEAPRRGYFRVPTPRTRNGGADSLLLLEQITFSRPPGVFTGSFTLTLSGAATGERIRYTLTAPGAAGTIGPEPGPTSPVYTGPITVSASTIVRAAVFAGDNLARGRTATAQYVRLATGGDVRLDNFDTQLPVVVVDTHGTGPLTKDNLDHPAWIYTWNKPVDGNTKLTTAPTLGFTGTANVRGASSATFPKKSYSLDFDDGQVPFGLPSASHWALVGPWKYDRTYLHNAFIYALSNQIGRWAPRTQLVEVFVNTNGGELDRSDYAGVYVFTETPRIDQDRINISSLDTSDVSAAKITGGYVLKSDLADPDEFSFQTRRGYPSPPFSLIVAEPKAAALAPAQRDYIRGYVQSFDDALTANLDQGWRQRTYLDYIDRATWVDHHILNVLAMNVDAFFRSAYMSKDRGARMVAGPIWDFDRTLDGGDARTQEPEVWNGHVVPGEDPPTELWGYGWWGMLAQDPEFVQEWIDRWQRLRTKEFSASALTTLVDSLAAKVGPAAAARDAALWPDNASRFAGGWQGEVNNLKTWLTRRVAWIDKQFVAPPTVVAAGGSLTFTPAAGTQLAYTTDGTDPRALGGAVANSTRLSATAVTVPASTNIQARGHLANFRPAGVPASAWSGAVGGPASSPLTPRPRLLNLSSRGFVGTGENILIAGVVVSDTAGKQYLARAVGPALTGFGVSGALTQPVLRILDNQGREVASNSGWESSADAADIPDVTQNVGGFPFARGSRDAALLTRLPFGQYTLQISSANGGTGVALAELYEVDSDTGRTLNLSTRGLVRPGEGLLIGGVFVRGPAPKRLLIRAIGPTLGSFGITGALADPVLELYQGAARIASNDDWGNRTGSTVTAAEITAATSAVGGFTLGANSRDAVILITLPEGAYTAQVTGKGTAQGVILLEIYELP